LFAAEIANYGSCRGNTTQALARWQHLVASHEAMDVLHRAMHPILYRRILMAIKIASNLPAFLLLFILLLATTVANNYVIAIII
jgi:hypothetical protein